MAADYRNRLRNALDIHDVPQALHDGLTEYFAARRPTGSFLRSVLENDLHMACLRADGQNRYAIADVVRFLHDECPANAWGSPAAVDAWLADPAPVPELRFE